MPKKKWFWNDIADGLLRRLYDPTVRGRSQEIAARLQVPLVDLPSEAPTPGTLSLLFLIPHHHLDPSPRLVHLQHRQPLQARLYRDNILLHLTSFPAFVCLLSQRLTEFGCFC